MELLKIKTSYIDANLILLSFIDEDVRSEQALRILRDTHRRLMVSDYVRLETLPKMKYFKLENQVRFTEALLRDAIYIRSSDAIIERAHALSEAYGLAGMDALHAASAIEGGADELLTFEKPSKPFFRIPPEMLKVVSLHEITPPRPGGS